MNIGNKVFKKLYLFSNCCDKEFVVEICPILKSIDLNMLDYVFEFGDSYDSSK